MAMKFFDAYLVRKRAVAVLVMKPSRRRRAPHQVPLVYGHCVNDRADFLG